MDEEMKTNLYKLVEIKDFGVTCGSFCKKKKKQSFTVPHQRALCITDVFKQNINKKYPPHEILITHNFLEETYIACSQSLVFISWLVFTNCRSVE